MMPKKFFGLHAHTGASIFDGLGHPKDHFDFVSQNMATESDVQGMAITEHGHMNSFAYAYIYAKELKKSGKKFKYIPGCEFYVHPDLKQWNVLRTSIDDGDSLHGGTVENEDETKSSKAYDPIKRRHHLVVLAKNSKALQKLFSTVSRGYLEGFYKFPRIDYSMLKKHKGEFVVTSACIGGPLSYTIFSHFQNKSFDELNVNLLTDAEINNVLRKLENDVDVIVDAVGRENFFIEIQFNKLKQQHLSNKLLIELSKKTGIQLVATADSHYCKPDVWRERELYKKLGWLNYSDISPKDLPSSIDDLKAELYPKNASQMWDEFKKTSKEYSFYDDKLVSEAIERSYDIAFNLIDDIQPDTTTKLPSQAIPNGKTAIDALKELCYIAMEKFQFNENDSYVKRLETELDVIEKKKFAEYFLTMKAIIDTAAEHMLVGPGRGSAAGSLVNYLLGITQVDPIKYNLIFERFINLSRDEYPDIDNDVADRDLLIKLLKQKFGDLNTIPVSNYNTFQTKSLIKDIARFFHQEENDGLDFQTVNSVLTPLDDEVRSKVLKQGDDKNLFELKLDDCLEHSSRFKEFMDKHPEVLKPIKILLHENKALGKHAGGVIIADDLPNTMPLILSRKEPQTPWVEGMHAKTLGELGYVKYDILGLETLRIIDRCIELILQRNVGKKVILELDNGKTIECRENDKVKLVDGTIKLIKDLSDNDEIADDAIITKSN